MIAPRGRMIVHHFALNSSCENFQSKYCQKCGALLLKALKNCESFLASTSQKHYNFLQTLKIGKTPQQNA